MSDKFKTRVAAAQAEKESERLAKLKLVKSSESLDSSDPLSQFIPDDTSDRSDEDNQMDRIMDAIDIITAYLKWCGKSRPHQRGNQTDSIKVSCPWPEHKDDHASASLNTEKNVFMCHGTCDKGGDKYDLAAIRFGYPIPGYKDGATFHQLRRQMAESLGYTFYSVPGKKEYSIEHPESLNTEPYNEDESQSTRSQESRNGLAESSESKGNPPGLSPVPSSDQSSGSQLLASDDNSDSDDSAVSNSGLTLVTPIIPDYDEDDNYFLRESKVVDQQAFIKPGTFLDYWMKATSADDNPEDYHFWNGLIALGMAVGRDVSLPDGKSRVFSNLFVCVLGPSGIGKSRSFRHVNELWKLAGHKFDAKAEPPRGVMRIKAPASGEVISSCFQFKYAPDPTHPQNLELAPIRGLIEFGELSHLHSVVTRRGNTLRPALMELYDGADVSSISLTTGLKEGKDTFGSLITTCQPGTLRDYITQSDIDSGYANRFIFATGKPKKIIEFEDFEIDLTKAVAQYILTIAWPKLSPNEEIKVRFSPDGREYAREFFEENVHPLERKSREHPLLTRINLTMKKMLLLVAINEREEFITPEMVDRAASILPYLLRSGDISGQNIAQSKSQQIEQAIREALLKEDKVNPGKGVTLNRIREMNRRRKYEIKDVNKALEEMIKMGEIDRIESQQRGPGRPSVRYRMGT